MARGEHTDYRTARGRCALAIECCYHLYYYKYYNYYHHYYYYYSSSNNTSNIIVIVLLHLEVRLRLGDRASRCGKHILYYYK